MLQNDLYLGSGAKVKTQTDIKRLWKQIETICRKIEKIKGMESVTV
jgi:hypothetical protein